jgi:hypothetical protein
MTDTRNKARHSRGTKDLAALERPGVGAARADLDVSRASAELVALVVDNLEIPVSDDVEASVKLYDPERVLVIDAVFGAGDVLDDIDKIRKTLGQIGGLVKPGAKYYPTKILGDETSGVIFFTAEPAALGHELNGVSAINFVDGLIRRQVIYSDGRHFTRAGIEAMAPGRKPVEDFGAAVAGEVAAPEIKSVAKRLCAAFADGDSVKAASLFASNATFEDLTLHASIFGTFSIEGFFRRALRDLPYGEGSTVVHVVGSAQGGGYEWASPSRAGNGIIALELDARGLVARASAMWDGSTVSAAFLKGLLGRTIEDGA